MKIPETEIQFIFSRSGGKGGQNVNKVESRVQLRWNVDQSAVFSFEQKMILSRALKTRMSDQGDVIVDVDTTRSQAQNRQEALARLSALIAKAMVPKKMRRPTRPSRAAKEKRLIQKRSHGQKKQQRRSSGHDIQ